MKSIPLQLDPGMRVFSGLPVSPGYGEGGAFLFHQKELVQRAAAQKAAVGDPAAELKRLEAACKAARNELEALAHNLRENYDLDESDIFSAHYLILEDELLNGLMRERIDKRCSAETAVAEAIASIEEMFRNQADPYIRERSVDVRDVGTRILRHLVDRHHHPFSNLPDAAVIVADELFPSDTVFLETARVRAIVTEHGSENSHAAILSRALGIPAVTGVDGILEACTGNELVVVDGESGRVFLRIDEVERASYGRRARAYDVAVREVGRTGEATTQDGETIVLLANVDREDQVGSAVEQRAAGIGLLRTEFLYLREGRPLAEERQTEIYRHALDRMGDQPVHLRIFDMASDKAGAIVADGFRTRSGTPECGIHYALAHPELLKPQLRAILRASEVGQARILLPGVTGVPEVEAFREVLSEVTRELSDQLGRRIEPVPVGAMIETPSSLLMLEEIADATEFLCLGTNDLLRHLFARKRARVEETACEPSLLRAIAHSVRVARERNREITVCGEVGGDPTFTTMLVGLGLRRLSMSPRRIPEVRYNVSQLRASDASARARRALRMTSAAEIDRLIREESDPWHRLLQSHEASLTD